eukprot:9439241-Pyramimonas_sp.AAC.1
MRLSLSRKCGHGTCSRCSSLCNWRSESSSEPGQDPVISLVACSMSQRQSSAGAECAGEKRLRAALRSCLRVRNQS